MRALVNLTFFCRLDKLNWKIGYRRFCSGQCLHRLARHVWSKGWDRRKSRPQPRFPAPRHRPLPHLLPLAITPPGEGRPCQPKDCPYPPDFTRLLLFGAPWSYPGHGLLGGNHSVVIGLGYASGHRSNEGRRCTSLVTRLRPSRSLIAVCSFHVMCSREHGFFATVSTEYVVHLLHDAQRRRRSGVLIARVIHKRDTRPPEMLDEVQAAPVELAPVVADGNVIFARM